MHGGKKKKNLTKAITLVKLTRCIQVQTEDCLHFVQATLLACRREKGRKKVEKGEKVKEMCCPAKEEEEKGRD
jgi:hypothetical protein